MILYIGGYAQGQYECAAQSHGKEKIINDFHLYVRKLMLQGKDIAAEVEAFLDENEDAVIICNEMGMGIVPQDEFERGYREAVGRASIAIAKRAKEVYRVFCGIPMRIK